MISKRALEEALGARPFRPLQWLPAIPGLRRPLRRMFGVRERLNGDTTVVLTFDDGPHPQGTTAVLERLAEAQAPATFFLVGEQVERRPQLAAEIVAAGHEVALHCQHHRNFRELSLRELTSELDRATAAIGEATGREVRWFRPPFGRFSTASLILARKHGWRPLAWSRSGLDWEEDATPDSIVANLVGGVRAGDVLLLHDADFYAASGSWRRTAVALPRILEAVERKGLTLAPL